MTAFDLFDVAKEFVQAHKHSSGDSPNPFIPAPLCHFEQTVWINLTVHIRTYVHCELHMIETLANLKLGRYS